MRDDVIHFRGAYRYVTPSVLDHALVSVRDRLCEDDVDDGVGSPAVWLRGLVRSGTLLTVDVALPCNADHRFVAAAVLDVLAVASIGGAVEARHAGTFVDFFPSGGDD